MQGFHDQKAMSDRRKISAGIEHWLEERKRTLTQFAIATEHSSEYVKKVIDRDPVRIELSFLHACVDFFGLGNYRTRSPEEMVDILSWDDCVKLIEPPPPIQNTLWDYNK